MKLPPDKRIRLVRLCGMLGSDFDGERANAGRMANALVRELGLTWDQVIVGSIADHQERREEQPRQNTPPRTPRQVADFCLSSPALWSAWERKFLTDMLDRVRLSERQEEILRSLYQRAKRAREDYR